MNRKIEETKFQVGDDVFVGTYKWRGTVTSACLHSSGIGMYYVKGSDLNFGDWKFDDQLTAAPPIVTLDSLFAQIEKLSARIEELALELKYIPGGPAYTEAKASFENAEKTLKDE